MARAGRAGRARAPRRRRRRDDPGVPRGHADRRGGRDGDRLPARADRQVDRLRLRRRARCSRSCPATGGPTRPRSPRRSAPPRSRVADASEVLAATGFEPGAVAPVPAAGRSTSRAVERTILQHAMVWIGAGSPTHMAGARPGRAPAARRRTHRGSAGPALQFGDRPLKEIAMQATEKIWMNGELVDWDDARIHVGVHGLHYGSGVFEGIRCYDTPKGPAVFRLTDHMQRLHNSARLINMELPYSVDELRGACNELLGANGLAECYIRPIAFYGFGQLGVSARDNPVETVIMSWPWGTYLGEEALTAGIRAKISTWQRIPAERRPARLEGDRRLPQLDARGQRGAARRLRRGDPAHARRERRRRPRRDDLRRRARQDLHARPLDRDPARDHARLDHPDRARPRLRGASRRT